MVDALDSTAQQIEDEVEIEAAEHAADLLRSDEVDRESAQDMISKDSQPMPTSYGGYVESNQN